MGTGQTDRGWADRPTWKGLLPFGGDDKNQCICIIISSQPPTPSFLSEQPETQRRSKILYIGGKNPREKEENSCHLLPQLAQADLLVVVLIEHLCGGEVEILLGDVDAALAQGVHAGLGADALELGAGAAVHLLRDLGQVDAAGQVHGAGVDAEDVGAGFDAVRGRKNC